MFGDSYYVGTTEDPVGVFAIIHNVLKIVDWGQNSFRKWFKRELLDKNWKLNVESAREGEIAPIVANAVQDA